MKYIQSYLRKRIMFERQFINYIFTLRAGVTMGLMTVSYSPRGESV